MTPEKRKQLMQELQKQVKILCFIHDGQPIDHIFSFMLQSQIESSINQFFNKKSSK